MSRSPKPCAALTSWTDHRLIVSKTKLQILPKIRPRGKKTFKKLNVSKLKQEYVATGLASHLGSKLENF